MPLIVRDNPEIPTERKVKMQMEKALNDKRIYMIEISFTKTKFIVIAASRAKNYYMELPKK